MVGQIDEVLHDLAEPPFRARQIADWKFRKLARSYAEMRNLPLALREELERRASLSTLEVVQEQQSVDGQTTKGVDNFYRLLEGKADQVLTLLVNDKPSLQGARTETVRPV